MINQSIFKAYDIRGIYPDDISETNLPDIIKAIYSVFRKHIPTGKLNIVLGRDMRLSGPTLFPLAKNALVESGANVIDIGLVSTPTVYFAVMEYGYDAGIQISASHNPKEYAGLKFFVRKDNKILKISRETGMDEVRERATTKNFISDDAPGTTIQKTDVVESEVKNAMEDIAPINKRRLKIVADTANGMGATYIEEIFKNYPVDLVKMNFDLDGSFPAHQADPLKFELLKDLQNKVLEEKADLGIAPDGDGDRVFFIDNHGKVIPATLITSLISKKILEKSEGETIVVDVRYVRNPTKIIEKYKGKISLSQVGHALITKQLNDERAIFAGESSGHFYFKEIGGAESAIRVILYVLSAIQEESKSISDIMLELQSSVESGEFNFKFEEPTKTKQLIAQIKQEFIKGKVNELDGLSVEFSDWRFNIRTSNTEPLLRLNVEGANSDIVNTHLDMLRSKIINAGGTPKS